MNRSPSRGNTRQHANRPQQQQEDAQEALVEVFLEDSSEIFQHARFLHKTQAAIVLEAVLQSGPGYLVDAKQIRITKANGELPGGTYRWYPAPQRRPQGAVGGSVGGVTGLWGGGGSGGEAGSGPQQAQQGPGGRSGGFGQLGQPGSGSGSAPGASEPQVVEELRAQLAQVQLLQQHQQQQQQQAHDRLAAVEARGAGVSIRSPHLTTTSLLEAKNKAIAASCQIQEMDGEPTGLLSGLVPKHCPACPEVLVEPDLSAGKNAALIPKLLNGLAKGLNRKCTRIHGFHGFSYATSHVVDTHSSPVFQECMPDITIHDHRFPASEVSARGFIEALLPGKHGAMDDKEHVGKMIRYLCLMLESLPIKVLAFGILTDSRHVALYQGNKATDGGITISRSRPFAMGSGGFHLMVRLITSTDQAVGYIPLETGLRPPPEIMGVLGHGRFSVVYDVEYGGQMMAMKAFNLQLEGAREAWRLEKRNLEKIRNSSSRHPMLPCLRKFHCPHTGPAMATILTTPVTVPLVLGDLTWPSACRYINIISALHATQLLHGDIEPRHLVKTAAGQPAVIDVGEGRDLGGRTNSPMSVSSFRGTTRFASSRLLQALEEAVSLSPSTQSIHLVVPQVQSVMEQMEKGGSAFLRLRKRPTSRSGYAAAAAAASENVARSELLQQAQSQGGVLRVDSWGSENARAAPRSPRAVSPWASSPRAKRALPFTSTQPPMQASATYQVQQAFEQYVNSNDPIVGFMISLGYHKCAAQTT
ncbi:hypothetical protein WJX72_002494 [[Myrmecia] bisecta]|uniref:Protein kinase domain-containing protein n=1 Tax=[Myrmecia] bisecta TaxID=41462 RepID=A0AAW1P0U7_9CHLO